MSKGHFKTEGLWCLGDGEGKSWKVCVGSHDKYSLSSAFQGHFPGGFQAENGSEDGENGRVSLLSPKSSKSEESQS